MAKALLKKVVVYCVRGDQLLVFRHLDFPWEEVGVQVPAGTIREGEPIEEAALRELREETGYDCFAIDGVIGSAWYDVSPHRAELHERHFVRARPTAPLPDRWSSREDHDGEGAPTRLECFWLPLKAGHVLQAGQGAMLWRLAEQA